MTIYVCHCKFNPVPDHNPHACGINMNFSLVIVMLMCVKDFFC